MLSKEFIKTVKRIEIVAKRAVQDQLAGQYHSVFKGRGMDFVDVRAYQPGDDIRVIDWNVSARMENLYIKQFTEERELTVLVLVDASGSQLFGTQHKAKREVAAELGALISLTAIKDQDRVGLLTFTDRVEQFLPPKKGRKHTLRVISEILEPSTQGKGTSISKALEYIMRITRKKTVIFLISDFQDDGYAQALFIANRRHEIVPIVLTDPLEERLPNLGLVHIENPETGDMLTVDTTSRRIREAFESAVARRKETRQKLFRTLKLDTVEVDLSQDHITPLIRYFRRRAHKA